MHSIRTAGDRNWETKETRRRSAGSVAKVGALEELDERTIANSLTDDEKWSTCLYSRHLVHVSSCRSHSGMIKCQLSP
jgi:hypothetical protein